MPDLQQPGPAFLEGMYQAIRSRAAGMAPRFQPGYDATELDGDDLEVVWNERAMPLEQEWELHRAMKPDGTPLYTREQIGLMVFHKREKLAKSGGRVEPKEWISWTNQTAKRMAAKREARAAAQAALAPPTMEGGY